MSASIKLGRDKFDNIINAGIKTAQYEFLSDIVKVWLDKYPNDIECKFQDAKLHHLQLDDQGASRILEELFISDPEYLPAYELFLDLNLNEDVKAVNSAIHVLSGKMSDISELYPWAVTLRAVRQGLKKKEYEHSEKLLRKIIAGEQQNLLAVVEHCRLSSLVDESQTLNQLAGIYHQRWPNCIQVDLFRAKALLDMGKEADAISLMHSCVSRDPAGLVANRMWGIGHEFTSLWPKVLFVDLGMIIPSNISVALNWNQLEAGEPVRSTSKTIQRPSTARSPEAEIEDISRKKRSSSKDTGAAAPVYVILSTRLGLEAKYGAETTAVILEKMEALSNAVQQKPNWESLVFLPDDFSYTDDWGITNISAVDPWKIKLALIDLDKALKAQSKQIGAVVIVGGHEVVPFHRLPNPTDDSDEDVLSDNPYATSSGNYLSPEWPVGRFPGEKGSDAGLILEQLRHAIDFHESSLHQSSFLSQAFSLLTGRTSPAIILRDMFKKPKDFGYSASVWRRSSLAAFRPIGKGSELRVSPEYDQDTIDIDNLMKAKCGYFNLHGMATTPEWYGQKDYSENVEGPDFPVAVSVDKIPSISNNIDLIVTEACYGGYIIDKTIDDSMALKLISIGSQGLVASTCISYGSVYTPLIGADLLTFVMWKYTKEGSSFGEAFMQAKLGLINVMNQRQGYLDGEDQKTLLSFVLYGDPLGCLEPHVYLEKSIARDGHDIDIKAVSDQDGALTKAPRISKEVSANLNEMLNSYLPSIDSASMKVREHKIRINKVIHMDGAKVGGQTKSEYAVRTQVMYSQKTKIARHTHEQFARVTLDEDGKVIKLAISR
jgi:hypothetical protein